MQLEFIRFIYHPVNIPLLIIRLVKICSGRVGEVLCEKKHRQEITTLTLAQVKNVKKAQGVEILHQWEET